MSETTYTLEYAKSSRSKCKKCKEPIMKGDIRIGVHVPAKDDGGYDMTSWHHVDCFKLPKKFAAGASAMSVEEFFQDMVTDNSDDNEILPARMDELVAKVTAASAAKTPKKAAKKKDADDDNTLVGRLKQAYIAEQSGDEKPAKKLKRDDDGEFDQLLELYKEHHKKKVDNLKDYLRWNRQLLKGNKDFVLFKVMDGFVHGRLGFCPLCGGQLKFDEGDEDHVTCRGRFDEDTKIPIPCDYKEDRKNCPRFQPWYDEQPTDEENEVMDKLKEAAQEEGDVGGGSDSPEAQQMLQAAAKFDWNLTEKTGIRQATADLVSLVEGKLDLPAGKDLKKLLGADILPNRDSTPEEIVKYVISKYGFAEAKEKKAAAKEAMAETVCANPKNAPLLLAFKELAEHYFKDGNRNAGGAYMKVTSAIKDMAQEITAENAMSFSKGKTKIPGIGKGSAEKMKEFMETGTMAKLEEKRGNA